MWKMKFHVNFPTGHLIGGFVPLQWICDHIHVLIIVATIAHIQHNYENSNVVNISAAIIPNEKSKCTQRIVQHIHNFARACHDKY